jgi:hypothetical protein
MSGERLIRTATNVLAAAAMNWNGYNSQPRDLFAHLAAALDGKQLLQFPEAGAELAQLRLLMNAQPADLSEAQIDALAEAGNRAINDYYHERACSCDLWPTSCHTNPLYANGYWDTDAFGIGAPAVVALWEVMRAAGDAGEVGRLRARIAELEAERHSTNDALAETTVALRAAEVARQASEPDAERVLLARIMAPDEAGACDACGDAPSKWCPDCAACRSGCHRGHVDNPCTHSAAPWAVAP